MSNTSTNILDSFKAALESADPDKLAALSGNIQHAQERFPKSYGDANIKSPLLKQLLRLPHEALTAQALQDFEHFGTVVASTMQARDQVIPLAEKLEALSKEESRNLAEEWSANARLDAEAFNSDSTRMAVVDQPLIEQLNGTLGLEDETALEWMRRDLIEALQEHAPEGYYFGSHWEDATNLGFWPLEGEER